jgi:hypothetical protein
MCYSSAGEFVNIDYKTDTYSFHFDVIFFQMGPFITQQDIHDGLRNVGTLQSRKSYTHLCQNIRNYKLRIKNEMFPGQQHKTE